MEHSSHPMTRLTHTLQGLSRSQLDAEPLLPALKRRAQQLAHVLFGAPWELLWAGVGLRIGKMEVFKPERW